MPPVYCWSTQSKFLCVQSMGKTLKIQFIRELIFQSMNFGSFALSIQIMSCLFFKSFNIFFKNKQFWQALFVNTSNFLVSRPKGLLEKFRAVAKNPATWQPLLHGLSPTPHMFQDRYWINRSKLQWTAKYSGAITKHTLTLEHLKFIAEFINTNGLKHVCFLWCFLLHHLTSSFSRVFLILFSVTLVVNLVVFVDLKSMLQ